DHPNTGTQMLDRTSRAPRRDRLTDGLAKSDEQPVVFDPVAARQDDPQRSLSLCRGARLDQAPSVGDPMDIGVDADGWLTVRLGDYQVGRFPSHSVERNERVDRVRNYSRVAFQKIAANPDDHFGLGAVEADGKNQTLDPALAQFKHRGGRSRMIE